MTDDRVHALTRWSLVVLVVVGAVLSAQPVWLVVPAAALALLTVALLPVAGRGVLVAALVGAGLVTLLCWGQSSNVGWFAICLQGGWCALWGGARGAAVLCAGAAGVFAVQVAVAPDPGWLAWTTGTVFGVVICLMARRQRDLFEQLRAAQAGLAETARAEERGRVARELHDVIAHSLTVSLLHVSAARLSVEEDDRAQAAEALGRAEELGRQSLSEVRHAVGLLRARPGERSPLPSAAELPGLVEGFRRAGAQVAYDVDGDPCALPATTGLTLYRIMQESLTNAVRHGGGAPTTVRLTVGAGGAELTVDSAGAPGSGTAGSGVAGMRERAEALSGRLTAGPGGSGWRVHAVLPA